MTWDRPSEDLDTASKSRIAVDETEILESIAGLLRRVSSGEKTLDIASRSIEFAARITGADFCALVVPELDYTYRIVDALGSVDNRTVGLAKKMSYSPVSRVLQGGERIVLTSAGSKSPGEIDDWIEAERLVDVILEPLVTRMGTKGLLAVGFRSERPEFRTGVPESSLISSATRAVAAFLSLAIESQEIVEAARTQAYHAEVLNVLLSKARRLGQADEMLAECLQTLARGLRLRWGVACLLSATPVELADAAELPPAGTTPGSNTKKPFTTIAEYPTQESTAASGVSAQDTPDPSEVCKWIERAAWDASKRLMEISQGNRGAPYERQRGGMVAVFASGKLGDASPPGFWVGFVPSAGKPSFVVGLRAPGEAELTSAEMRLLQRLAEEFSHYLSYAEAFAAEREAVRRLTDLDRTKSELLSIVSHELRTPLTSIRGFTSSLLDGLGSLPEDKQRRFLSIIDTQAEKLSKLIDDFLDMSRLQEGAVVLEIGRVDLSDVVDRIAEHYSSQASEKGMRIEVSRERVDDAIIQADESKVEQIVTNLVSNAIKYGEGTVRIVLGPLRDGFSIAVEDEGPGVPEEKQKAIFERFVQADSSSTRRVSGVGLGLAIAKGLAEAHGGALWYEPRQPRGARFVAYLPIVPRPATRPGA